MPPLLGGLLPVPSLPRVSKDSHINTATGSNSFTPK